jgi:hypothetical protein
MTVGHDLERCEEARESRRRIRLPARGTIVKLPQRTVCTQRQSLTREDRHMFQIVRLTLDDKGDIAVRRPLQPLFELREDAMAMAEFDASRLLGDYGCDDERDCWWATDARGCKYRFIVEPVASNEAAA